MMEEECLGELTAVTERVRIERIQWRSPHEASENLGFQQRPDGGMEDELETMMRMVTEWTERMCKSQLDRKMMRCALNSTI